MPDGANGVSIGQGRLGRGGTCHASSDNNELSDLWLEGGSSGRPGSSVNGRERAMRANDDFLLAASWYDDPQGILSRSTVGPDCAAVANLL